MPNLYVGGNINGIPISSVISGASIVATVSANTTISADVTLVNTTSAAITVTLPTAIGVSGRKYIINDKIGKAYTNNITITTTASQTINGATSIKLQNPYESVTMVSDGANWFII
jgi:hypothetical protein